MLRIVEKQACPLQSEQRTIECTLDQGDDIESIDSTGKVQHRGCYIISAGSHL